MAIKSVFNSTLITLALLSGLMLTSCKKDLDPPQDENVSVSGRIISEIVGKHQSSSIIHMVPFQSSIISLQNQNERAYYVYYDFQGKAFSWGSLDYTDNPYNIFVFDWKNYNKEASQYKNTQKETSIKDSPWPIERKTIICGEKYSYNTKRYTGMVFSHKPGQGYGYGSFTMEIPAFTTRCFYLNEIPASSNETQDHFIATGQAVNESNISYPFITEYYNLKNSPGYMWHKNPVLLDQFPNQYFVNCKLDFTADSSDYSFYFIGHKTDMEGNITHITMLHTDKEFNVNWQRDIQIKNNMRCEIHPNGVIKLENGNFLLTGYTQDIKEHPALGTLDMGSAFVAMLSPSGDILWKNIHNLSSFSDRYYMGVISNGALYACGETYAAKTGETTHSKALISKISLTDGSIIKQYSYGTEGAESSFRALFLHDGKIYAGGHKSGLAGSIPGSVQSWLAIIEGF